MSKPLISDAVLRGMYQTMQRLRFAKREPGALDAGTRAERSTWLADPESLLAAVLSQVHRRDTVLTQGRNPLLAVALAASDLPDGAPTVHTCMGTAEEGAAVAAGMALRATAKLRAAKSAPAPIDPPQLPVMIAILNDFPALKGVLQLIEEHDLPVLLIVGGDMETRVDAQKRLQSTKVPVMPVDRSDAVAICRVMQECLLRARNGWGGAVIHAVHMPGVADSLLLLRQHLENRARLSAGSTTLQRA